MQKRFEGKVAIVTGGARGLGKATVTMLHAEGAKVVATDINAETLAEAYAGCDESILPIVADVNSEEDWYNVINETLETYGKIDHVVNNASVFLFKDFLDYTVEDFDKVMGVCARGSFLGTHLCAKVMVDAGNGGSIVNIGSICAHKTAKDRQPAYGAAKRAMVGYSRRAAKELAPYNIRVNVVHPGTMMGDYQKEMLAKDPAFFDSFKPNNPLAPYFSDPEDVAEAVLFLLSDNARCITGVELNVDCGNLA